jgi:LPS-assembly protein
MQIPLRSLKSLFLGATLTLIGTALAWALVLPAHALEDSSPIQATGTKEVWNRAQNKVELFGNAVVRQLGESLQADYIALDQKARTLDARGNCVYITSDAVIYGEEMHFNLDSRTGTVVGGRVATDRFTLAGERINKLGANRFQTHWGEYSTCKDCPQSWTFTAKDVDMEVEGYAFMSDVRLKIKDTSALWFPYLIIPMKSRRQTGFLFPRYQLSSQDGFVFVEPFFWAINRSSDMTIGLGTYTDRGLRAEWEGRYALTDRSKGTANFFYLRDRTLSDPSKDGKYNPSNNLHRWGLDITQTQELPWNLEEKLRITDASDNLYPFRFGDLSQKNEAYLESSFNLGYSSSDISANINARVYRNLLNLGPVTTSQNSSGQYVLNPVNPDFRAFDTATVQAFPSVTMTTNDRPLFHSNFIGGLTLGMTNFTRGSGGYDSAYQDQVITDPTLAPPASYRPGVDPLRKATRFSLTPSIYTTFQPVDGVVLTPSVQYNSFYYFFRDISGVTPLYHAWPLLQLDLSTQFEKVFDLNDPEVPRRKHLIRPFLTYSNIPFEQKPGSHPFIEQINFARNDLKGKVGYNFDDNDIVPRDNAPFTQNYFVPLGNSVSYGFRTQLIDRVGALDQPAATYRMPMEFSAGQTFNLREYQINPTGPQPFSRLFTNLKTNYFDRITTDTTYYYYPYIPGIKNQVSSSITYILERGLHQRILTFDRSFNLNYSYSRIGYTGDDPTGTGTHQLQGSINYSLNDYLLPSASGYYNFITHRLDGWGYGLSFQSPSQCWRISTAVTFDPTQGHVFSAPAISLNLTGAGFEGVGEISGQTSGSTATH